MVQPVAVIVPVTVYTVETVGLAITVVPVGVFRPVAGDHDQVFALPLAVRVTGAQKPLGPEFTTGMGLTVSVAELELVVPHTLVTAQRNRLPL